MKILANLTALVKKTDANLPFDKTIQDETDTQPGTPIVADLMRDLFSNFYRLLELAKITPTNEFDGDSTQYQLIDALKKLPNSMNDIEQVLTLDGSIWSVPLDLSILPNKYVFFARATDDYNSDTSLPAPDYTFKGMGSDEYTFTSDNFNSGDELLVVIDISGVRAYPLRPIPKYKVYTALLTQSGFDAPTAVVLENTLGEITFEMNGTGSYKVISDSLFIDGKTFVLIGSGVDSSNAVDVDAENALFITSRHCSSNDTGLTLRSNDILYNTPIEIRVYN